GDTDLVTLDDAALHRQLVAGAPQGLDGHFLADTSQLEHDAARAHDRHPVLRVALAGAHAGLGRLLGHGLVWEDADPDLATTANVVRDGAAGGFDLPAVNPCRFQRLQPELAEGHVVPPQRPALHAAAEHFPVL